MIGQIHVKVGSLWMLNAIKRVPAGTFLVPMLVSALIYTIAPNLFEIGGLTQHIFGGPMGLLVRFVFVRGLGLI